MADFQFNVTQFRIDYPQFADPIEFPDYYLQEWWNNAICYINPSTQNYGRLQGTCKLLALNLMTAHLAAISVFVRLGQVPGMLTQANIDVISDVFTPPPLPNQWQWWMGLTPYGQRLLALLQTKSVGGFYITGLPETTAIRRWGGLP